MSNGSERRRAPRASHEQALTIKVINSSTRSIVPGHTFQAHTADVSDNGVRVRLLTAVPVGADLEMWVISPVQQETLVVSGKVRWCLASPGDATRHQAGIEIARKPTTDFRKWQNLAASLTGG
jgi:hypothetical protein